MTAPPFLLALLVVLTAGCGDTESPAPAAPNSAAPAPVPTTAVNAPAEAPPPPPGVEVEDKPAPTPAPEAEAAPTPEPQPVEVTALEGPALPADGLLRVVVVAEHTLLRSEDRLVDGLLRALRRGSLRVERVDGGDQSPALTAWLSTTARTERQAALGQVVPPTHPLADGANALLLLSVPPPVEQRSQGIARFAVLAGTPLREVVFGDGALSAKSATALSALLVGAR